MSDTLPNSPPPQVGGETGRVFGCSGERAFASRIAPKDAMISWSIKRERIKVFVDLIIKNLRVERRP